jgi:hypothetical protein
MRAQQFLHLSVRATYTHAHRVSLHPSAYLICDTFLLRLLLLLLCVQALTDALKRGIHLMETEVPYTVQKCYNRYSSLSRADAERQCQHYVQYDLFSLELTYQQPFVVVTVFRM